MAYKSQKKALILKKKEKKKISLEKYSFTSKRGHYRQKLYNKSFAN